MVTSTANMIIDTYTVMLESGYFCSKIWNWILILYDKKMATITIRLYNGKLETFSPLQSDNSTVGFLDPYTSIWLGYRSLLLYDLKLGTSSVRWERTTRQWMNKECKNVASKINSRKFKLDFWEIYSIFIQFYTAGIVP